MGVLADTGLGLKIKTALLFDGRVDGRDIGVRVYDGVTWLHGSVRYPLLRDLVEGVAVRNGAHEVVNRIHVQEADHVPISEIIPAGYPGVSAPAGAEPVREPTVQEQVQQALAADERVNSHLIICQVDNGIVYLKGRQDNVVQKDTATEVASHVPGVYGVINELEVLPSI